MSNSNWVQTYHALTLEFPFWENQSRVANKNAHELGKLSSAERIRRIHELINESILEQVREKLKSVNSDTRIYEKYYDLDNNIIRVDLRIEDTKEAILFKLTHGGVL
ncbi:hypothetical protein [Brucella rhizosphaerae]|uniref:hypothetical protein n=1 Tax=Brucella rhizosphaerae TaxID=571254 RepID=UPI000B98E0DF|nr:hypothetical protein [Brucella rhizosphaerae]